MAKDNGDISGTNDAPDNTATPGDDGNVSPSSLSRWISEYRSVVPNEQPDAGTADTGTRLNEIMTAGIAAGGISGAVWHAADNLYVQLPEALQSGNRVYQFFGDHLSPTSRALTALSDHNDALQSAFRQAQLNEQLAADTFAGSKNAVDSMISATGADPTRGAEVADLQRSFLKEGNLSDSAVRSRSMLDISEVGAAKGYVAAASEAAETQRDLLAANHALQTANNTYSKFYSALPPSLTTDAAKSAWLSGRPLREMTDDAILQARTAGGGRLFDAVDYQMLRAYRDASGQQVVAKALEGSAETAATTAATAHDAAALTLETTMSGQPNAPEKLMFVKTPGITAQAIEESATFTPAEAAVLTGYSRSLADKVAGRGAASQAAFEVTAANSAMDNARNQIVNANLSTMGGLKGLGMSIGKGAGIGLATASVNIAADYLVSKALGEEPKLTGTSAWGFEMAAIPYIMFNPKMAVGSKIAWSAAAYIGSNLFGQVVGEPTGRFSALAQPSWTETGLSAVGAMLPLSDWRLRATAAVVGWGLGKAYNVATSDRGA